MAELRQDETKRSESDEIGVIQAILALPEPSGRVRTVIEVTQLWGDVRLDQRQFAIGRAVTIGATPRATLQALGVDVVDVPAAFAGVGPIRARWVEDFFAPDGVSAEIVRGAEVHPPIGWQARVYRGGVRVPTPDGAIALDAGTRVVLALDGIVFVVRLADAGARVVEPIVDRIDWGSVATGSAVLGLLAILGVALQNIAPADTSMMDEAADDMVIHVLQQLPERGPAAAAAAEGSRPRKEKRTDAPAKKAPGAKRPGATAGDVLATIFDGPDFNLGDGGLPGDMQAAIDALHGPSGVDLGPGGIGLGQRGPGFGGPGGVQRSGGMALSGVGNCLGEGCGSGLPPKGEAKLPSAKEVITIGGLDASLIDEVIKRHLPQIKYCYSRALQRQTDLAGKVVVRFTIAKDGSVSSSSVKSSSMGSSEVETCVARRIGALTFPQPKGGIVIVSYPFVFAPG